MSIRGGTLTVTHRPTGRRVRMTRIYRSFTEAKPVAVLWLKSLLAAGEDAGPGRPVRTYDLCAHPDGQGARAVDVASGRELRGEAVADLLDGRIDLLTLRRPR